MEWSTASDATGIQHETWITGAYGITLTQSPTHRACLFDGQRRSLDHALASGGIADAVTGVAEWHINADEPDLLNCYSRFNDPSFYEPSLYAASDHDPVILGLALGSIDTIA